MPQQVIKFEIKAQLAWRVFQSASDNWIGICDPLKITMEGATFQELTERINEALQLLMADLFETGELEDFLRRQGWRPMIDLSKVDPANATFDVPFDITKVEDRRAGRELAYS